ncbi:MAG: hypothetical protein LIP77_00355, partial [Planctomycetes bacterium]|nr:hypothetical protein [Planctomycetota bacterium]
SPLLHFSTSPLLHFSTSPLLHPIFFLDMFPPPFPTVRLLAITVALLAAATVPPAEAPSDSTTGVGVDAA